MVAVLTEISLQCCHIVVRQTNGMSGEVVGNPGTGCRTDVSHRRTGTDQQVVGMSVIVALKLDERVATGKATSHTNGRHGSLCTAIDKAHAFHRRERIADTLSQEGLVLSGYAIAGTALYGLDGPSTDSRVVMSEDEDAP